jgi:periplasmic protein CpxP/Spy
MSNAMHIAVQRVSQARGSHWRRASLALLLGSALLGSGVEVLAQPAPQDQPQAAHRDHMNKRSQEPGRHREWMMKRTLARIGASKEQQQKIGEIWTQTHNDIRALREQRIAGRKAMTELLTKPSIDRAAIEAQRVQQMKLADTVSARITKAIADSAEVLTPEQRIAFAQRMQRGRGHRGMHGGGRG